jgi:cobalt/nickel transport system ATP-binding protein
MDPDVMVFDEPTSGLDPSGSEDIMELLDELNHGGKTVIISTHDVELAYPWADRAILLLEGRILQEGIPEVAFGHPEFVRMAHLSLPLLLELYTELQKRSFPLTEKKPRTILDLDNEESLVEWISSHPEISVGAMGTRAKQRAENRQIRLDFTYGVIDKCILKALLGDDSLILTTGSMVDRVHTRVEDYGKESGIHITVNPLEPGIVQTNEESRRQT